MSLGVINGSRIFSPASNGLVFQGRAVKRFVVAKEFVPHTSLNDDVKIGEVGVNFHRQYYSKTEREVGECAIGYHRLKEARDYMEIYRTLDHESAIVPLAHVHQMISAQTVGEEGSLASSGSSNLFFCFDRGSTVGLVFVVACSQLNFWDVLGGSLERPDKFFPGSRVFYRVGQPASV